MTKIVILGLGKTGYSCVSHLVAHGSNEIIVMDTRELPPYFNELQANFPEVPCYRGEFDSKCLKQADQIIISPGISLHEPAVQVAQANNIPIVGDIELFAQQVKAPVAAVTGSNGKSTVVTLVGEMVRASGKKALVAGNIGLPVLDALKLPVPDFYILELSSFQLETTQSLAPLAAANLNLQPDHLDRYEDLSAYLKAKQKIYTHCQIAVINRDQRSTVENLELPQTISFGMDHPQEAQFGLSDGYLWFGQQRLIHPSELRIAGQHNWSNALAALAIGQALGLPLAAMIAALKNFHGLAHRCQWAAAKNGITWFNDSKGTNVGASCAAISGLGDPLTKNIILIAGGQGKNADFSPLREVVAAFVKVVILIGIDAPLIEQALQGAVPIYRAKSLKQAVSLAHEHAVINDKVLLSPACASLDMFKNFEERGEIFMQTVKELLDE